MNGVKYISWADTTGYSVTAQAYIKLLANSGMPVSWTPMTHRKGRYRVDPNYTSCCPILESLIFKDVNYDTVIIHCVPELFSQFITEERILEKKVLGMTVWEHQHLPMHWLAILNQLDGVIVPCQWNKDVFRQSGVIVPIYVVPHLPHVANIEPTAAAISWWQNKLVQHHLKKPTIFYNIAFWNHRKAPYLSLEAFLATFNSTDNVALILKTTRIDVTATRRPWWALFRLRYQDPHQVVKQRLARYRRETGKAPPTVITVADERLSDDSLAALHHIGDIFFSTSRAEGWGMGAYDAAILGKPVVIPNYGGQIDFLTEAHPYWLRSQLTEVTQEPWPHKDKPVDQWAEPNLLHAKELLYHFSTDSRFKQQAEKYSQAHANWIKTAFSEQAIYTALLKALETQP